MKIMTRILLILLATAVVVSATWLLTPHIASSQFLAPEARFRPSDDLGGESFFPAQRPEGHREGSFEWERGGFLLFGWLRDIGVIAIIVAAVVLFERLLEKKRLRSAVSLDDGQNE